ncbi:MAG: hypothetical protein ABI995_00680 [Acidobacteriota bacterium]
MIRRLLFTSLVSFGLTLAAALLLAETPSAERPGGLPHLTAMTAAVGSQRIVLITQRRLGATNQGWNAASEVMPNPYEFSVIELRLNAKGEGEGKASFTGTIAPDTAAKIVTAERHETLPAVFRDVRLRRGQL